MTKNQKNVTSLAYFCDSCETKKDGMPYHIKITARPEVISTICPVCRPNVVKVMKNNWKEF